MGKKSLKTFLYSSVSAAAFVLASAPANAATVDELEAKLNAAVALIEQQSKQMEELSSQLQQVKLNKVAPASGRTNVAQFEERLAEIEDTVFDLDDKVGSRAVVNAFDAASLDIGGFVHSTYTYVDTDTGSAGAFDTQNFELIIKADLDENWSAFVVGGFLREEDNGIVLDGAGGNPDFTLANKNPLIIGWVNYKYSDALNIQAGRQITPHGIVNIEHFPQILLDPRQPQFLRPFGGDTLFPNFTTGVQAHGKFFYDGGDSLQYNAYAAADQSDPEALIYGGRVAYTHADSGATFGLNALTGDRSDLSGESGYSVIGADLRVENDWLLWKSEIFQSYESTPDADDRFAFYAQPAWKIDDQWTVFYRYDYLESVNQLPGITDTLQSTENVVGITYKPKPNVHLRLTATDRDIEADASTTLVEDSDSTVIQASATVSF